MKSRRALKFLIGFICFTLDLPCSCPRSVLRSFQVLSGISRWNGSRSRLRHHNRRKDTNIKAFSSTPSNPREPCIVPRPFDTSRICFEEDLNPFDHPFGRTGAGSGEWAEDFKGNSSKPIRNGKWCWIRSNAAGFERMDYSFGRMASKLYQNVPGLAGNPKWSPIRANAPSIWPNSSLRLRDFFSSQTKLPRLLRHFTPFVS